MAAYTRCLRCAGAPRRPASGSELSLTIPSWHAVLSDPGELDHRYCPVSRCRHGSSPKANRLDTPNYPAIRFARGLYFRASLVRDCYGLSDCSPPCTDQAGIHPQPTRGAFAIFHGRQRPPPLIVPRVINRITNAVNQSSEGARTIVPVRTVVFRPPRSIRGPIARDLKVEAWSNLAHVRPLVVRARRLA